MSGLRGGTDHSASARSNERALRQERSANAIEAAHGGEHTFDGVRETLRRYKMVFDGDVYTITTGALRNWALSMLKAVGAPIISDNAGTIQFTAPMPKTLIALRILPVWRSDEILMLPAQSAVKRWEPKPAPATTYREIKIREMRKNGFINLDKRVKCLPKRFYFTADGQDKTREMQDWLMALKPQDRKERRESSEKIDYKALAQNAGESTRNNLCIAKFATKQMNKNGRSVIRLERIK